jgi:ribosomal protein S18 acetylase RimI-like enzyme
VSTPVPEITVRAATAGDVPAIAALAGQLYAMHHAWDPDRFWDLGGEDEAHRAGRERFFASQLAAADSVLLVAERAGVAVGYAYLAYESHDYASLLERAAWLHDVFVVPDARRGEVADRLFDAVCERARADGYPLLVLSVAEANPRARAFFARHGARVTMREMVVPLTARTGLPR